MKQKFLLVATAAGMAVGSVDSAVVGTLAELDFSLFQPEEDSVIRSARIDF